MLVPWLPVVLSKGIENAKLSIEVQTSSRQTFGGDELIVTSETSDADPVAGVYTFDRGVVARYGLTTVRCDRLIVDQGKKWASATGNVEVSDPEADLRVSEIQFSWDPTNRTGRAKDVRAQIGNVLVSAREAEVTPTKYTFLDVAGTSCHESTPFYEIKTRRLVVTPGQVGRAEKPELYFFGKKLITLPSRSFTLDPRTEGFRFPTATRRQDGRTGISWSSGFLLDDRTNLNANYASFQRTRVNYGVTVTRSYVPATQNNQVITPPTEFQERFGYGYFDNIRILTPEQETGRIGIKRAAVGIGSTFNQGPTARADDAGYSKPLEIFGDQSARVGGGAYRATVRLQSIQKGDDPLHLRASIQGVYKLPDFKLAPNLNTTIRLDTNLFAGNTPYGWGRSQFGLVFRPHPAITLAAAGILTGEVGSPLYPGFDTPFTRNGYVWRADINLGPTKMSFLQKYDSRLGLYDREYTISQVVGCFEPFVLYRKFPNEYVLGMRLRLDPFYRAIRQRSFHRTKPPKSTTPVKDDEE